jgi:Ca-activated chloride channel family protein
VSFAATASVVQSPTHSKEDIIAAIDRFHLQRGTRSAVASWCR